MIEPFGIAGTADGPAVHGGRAWAASIRKLSVETLERLGVGFGTTFFPDLRRKSNALFFHYGCGWKARAVPEKSHVCGGGFRLSFFNIEAVLRANPQAVYFTEGELDACALVEAGIAADSVLSVPNGARQRPADDPSELRGYDYVAEALRLGLNRAQRFVWCGDNDDPGHILREDMVHLLGPARFAFVDWPEGCKDANDMLRTDGAQAVHELVRDGAQPWPVAGLYRLDELPEPAPFTLWRPGFPQWEGKLKLAPRTLSAATGHPGHGKTGLLTQIWFQIARDYAIQICAASFETRPKPHLRRQLRSLFAKKLECQMSADEIDDADRWIKDHYLFLAHPEQRPTLEWVLDMAEVAVIRHGARVLYLDPWNRLESARERDESETDYIGRALRTLYVFASDMNCHVMIVAHPAKMHGTRHDHVPDLSDISGSKHWDNMVDQGFVVHRPKIFDGGVRKTECELYHRKARFNELGYPCLLAMNYRIDTGAYVATDYEGYA